MKPTLTRYLNTCDDYWRKTAPHRYLGCTPAKLDALLILKDFTCRVIYPANERRAVIEISESRQLLMYVLPPVNHPEYEQAHQLFTNLMQLVAGQLAHTAKRYERAKNLTV